MAASAASLSAFQFSFWVRSGDYRTFEVLAFDYAAAILAACVASDDSDSLHYNGVRHELAGVCVHALSRSVPALVHDSITERQLAALFPIDPRD